MREATALRYIVQQDYLQRLRDLGISLDVNNRTPAQDQAAAVAAAAAAWQASIMTGWVTQANLEMEF